MPVVGVAAFGDAKADAVYSRVVGLHFPVEHNRARVVARAGDGGLVVAGGRHFIAREGVVGSREDLVAGKRLLDVWLVSLPIVGKLSAVQLGGRELRGLYGKGKLCAGAGVVADACDGKGRGASVSVVLVGQLVVHAFHEVGGQAGNARFFLRAVVDELLRVVDFSRGEVDGGGLYLPGRACGRAGVVALAGDGKRVAAGRRARVAGDGIVC